MLPTDRIAYSAITERAPLKLPDGARMAVWVIASGLSRRTSSPLAAPSDLQND
jgi:hypothetical protein